MVSEHDTCIPTLPLNLQKDVFSGRAGIRAQVFPSFQGQHPKSCCMGKGDAKPLHYTAVHL